MSESSGVMIGSVLSTSRLSCAFDWLKPTCPNFLKQEHLLSGIIAQSYIFTFGLLASAVWRRHTLASAHLSLGTLCLDTLADPMGGRRYDVRIYALAHGL